MTKEEKKAIDKAIYELEDSYELHQREWAKKCLNTIKHGFTKLQKENEKYKQFFDLMLRLDAGYFFHCEDEETNKLVDDILKLESEE